MLRHVPGEDEIPAPQIDLLDLKVNIGAMPDTAVGSQVCLHDLGCQEQRVSLGGDQEFVHVRSEAIPPALTVMIF